MNKFVSYKYRLCPNKTQATLLNKTMGCVRFVWNCNVAIFNSYDKETNLTPIFKTSTELRKEYQWLKEVSAAAIQQKEMDFKEFKKQRFSNNRKKKMGNPSFKKKGHRDSFRLPNQKFKILDNKIHLEKIGKVKMIIDRELPIGKLMSVTISKNPSGQYFASILINTEKQPLPKTNKSVGIDLGLKAFIVTSDNEIVNNPRYFRKNQSKLKKNTTTFIKKKERKQQKKQGKIESCKIT